MAAMLLPMSINALTLEPNQMLMGHYTTDDLSLGGCWGMSFLRGERPIATDITPDELAIFQGSEIVAFRVGLSLSTTVSRVFVIPVAPDGTLGVETAWLCNVNEQGWNLIELETPYLVNLPDDYSLRIGFDYEQVGSQKPISAVKVGNYYYPSMCYYSNQWKDYGVSTYGNLSVQCVTRNDHYPQYIIRSRDLICRSSLVTGNDITFSLQACNLGTAEVAPGALSFNVAIDGNIVDTYSNPIALGQEYTKISGATSSTGLAAGLHTLTLTTATLNGQPIEDPISLTATFTTFDYGFTRQMRLVEQFTSTHCTFCPQGSANIQSLCDMRDDIAWISIHENMGSTDPFRTPQCDSIKTLQLIDGYPEGTFDRTMGIGDYNNLYVVLTYLSPMTMSTFLDSIAIAPSWATVNVNSTYDSNSRQAVITIDGQLVPDYEDHMGNDSRLTVYITEDGLVAPQVNGGNDYVHNNVLRSALISVKGVAINKTGNAYRNEFTIDIPNAWNADNLNIVAFISRLLGNPITDLYVTNANKRRLGESDPSAVLPGDANGDGMVNVDDVTIHIDMLLGAATPSPGADVDGDGKVTIDDTTTLIDMLLSNH